MGKEKPLPVSRQGLVRGWLESWFAASFPTAIAHMREEALVNRVAILDILGVAIAALLDLPDTAVCFIWIAFGGMRPNDPIPQVDGLDCCGTEQRIDLLLDRRILVIQVP